MTEISIIIPAYNSEKYIAKCLNSLINQTFNDIEIICIEDGSTDKSRTILQDYAKQDNRIKIFAQKNSGPAIARNKGLEVAIGKYLMFCDSDDWYEPNMCEVMYKAIIEQDVDIVQCGTIIEKGHNSPNRKNLEQYLNTEKTGKFQLRKSNFHFLNVLLWNKIWKKSIIDKYNIKFPNAFNHEDDAFSYMYKFVCQNFFILNQNLYHYAINENSLMDRYKKNTYNRFSRIIISEFVGDFLIKNNMLKKNKNLLFCIFQGQLKNLQQIFSLKEIIPMIRRLEKYCQKKIDRNINFLIPPSGEVLIINTKEVNILNYARCYFLSKITFGKMRKHYKEKKRALKAKIKAVRRFLKGK